MDKTTLHRILEDIEALRIYDWGHKQRDFAVSLLERLSRGEDLLPQTTPKTVDRMAARRFGDLRREAFRLLFFAECVTKHDRDKRRGRREAGALMRLAVVRGH